MDSSHDTHPNLTPVCPPPVQFITTTTPVAHNSDTKLTSAGDEVSNITQTNRNTPLCTYMYNFDIGHTSKRTDLHLTY